MNSAFHRWSRVVLNSALLGALGLLAAVPGLHAAGPSSPAPALVATPAEMQAGRKVFGQICFSCHQMNGQGLPGLFPPLARSDFLRSDRDGAIGVLLHGRQGPITVNGRTFNNVMPELHLNDRQIADVLTYVLNSWGNAGGAVTVTDVARVRGALAAK